MSLPYPTSSPSSNQKHPSAESRGKGEGLGGSDPVSFIGPPPAPAHRVHSQGKEFYLREKSHSGRRPDFAVADETQQNQNSAASAEAKSTLCRVKDSSNTYLPLKSVAKDLYFILDNCEVQYPPSSQTLNPWYLRSFLANRGESTGHRVIGATDQSAFRIPPRTQPTK